MALALCIDILSLNEERDFPQTVTTSLEALYCPKYHYMLQH